MLVNIHVYRANQTQLNSSHANGPILYHILSKLSLSDMSKTTFARTEGLVEDLIDPDDLTDLNQAFKVRQLMYCSTDRDNVKVVNLSGLLQHDLRYLTQPFPSDIAINFVLTKSKNKQLIDYQKIVEDDEDPFEFRLRLVNFELYLLRKIFDVNIHEKTMSLLNRGENTFLRYFYNRVQVINI